MAPRRDILSGKFRKAGSFNNDLAQGRTTLQRGIAQFEAKMRAGFQERMEPFAQRMLDYAIEHAPWEDRTGEARQGLGAEYDDDPDEPGISLFHTVEYGIWLEVRWGGKYAIIIPTVEFLGPGMMAELKGMMDRIVFYE